MTIFLQHKPETILLFEGVENYTLIHFKNGKQLMTSQTLLRYEERFDNFIRVSRKYLVNKKYVVDIKTSVEKPYFLLSDGRRIYIPRRRVKEFE